MASRGIQRWVHGRWGVGGAAEPKEAQPRHGERQRPGSGWGVGTLQGPEPQSPRQGLSRTCCPTIVRSVGAPKSATGSLGTGPCLGKESLPEELRVWGGVILDVPRTLNLRTGVSKRGRTGQESGAKELLEPRVLEGTGRVPPWGRLQTWQRELLLF